MKLSDLKKKLKEIKEIVDYKDADTDILIVPRHLYLADYTPADAGRLELSTSINGYAINILEQCESKK